MHSSATSCLRRKVCVASTRSSTRPPARGRLVRVIGYAVLCVGFSLLLQPAWGGLLAAVVLGLFVGLLATHRLTTPQMLMPVLVSFLVASIVFASAQAIQVENPIPVLIPPLIPFLPGAALTTGTVELAAGQTISGSSRAVQGVLGLALMAFGIVAAADLVGVPDAHLLDHPFDRLGPWAPWIGLVVITVGHFLHNCAPRRTLIPIFVVLLVAYAGRLAGAAVFGANVSGFFGALAVLPRAQQLRIAQYSRHQAAPLQLELQCLSLVDIAGPAFRLLAVVAKGVDCGAEFRFGLVHALNDASEVVAKKAMRADTAPE